MAAVEASLPLSHFYRETLGTEHLSQNLRSNELFTPLQLNRVTVSPTRYEQYRSLLEKQPRLPWGRLRDYGGLQKVQLPEEFIKLKGFPPEVVQKGHRHYGTGASDPRDLKVEQYYDITDLHKSQVRTSDQVLLPSPHKEMTHRQVNRPFPAEHPYTSHMSRFALFPKYTTPDDPESGDPARCSRPLHSNAPANAHKAIVMNKSKGAPFRRELQHYPLESEKSALEWSGEDDFYQLMKSPDRGRQPYYPTPPKIVHPNLRLRQEDQRLELRSANALRNLERDQWKTTYDYNYTGNGPSNVMHIDDYHKKLVDEIQSGRQSRNNDMIPLTSPTFLPPRPLEGRYARLYQQKRHLSADVRYPDDVPDPDPVDVMDSREYTSLPGSSRALRRKDEWYKTATSGQVVDDDAKVTSSKSSPLHDDDVDDQWRSMQLKSHSDHGLQTVTSKKEAGIDPRKSGEYDRLPKNVEELEQLPEVKESYLKNYQDERDKNFKTIERRNEKGKLELQYQPMQDLHAMRNKVDQIGTRFQPLALAQHQDQVSGDLSLLDDVKMGITQREATSYRTGLKFSTENISDCGPGTALHDRQLEGYETFPTTWRRHIPVTDPPEQNHRGNLERSVTRTNPFSMSLDAERLEGGADGVMDTSGSSTGSILRTPGSPPRTGSSRSISFNEVVRVATTEYGTRFKLSTSPLSSADSSPQLKTTRPSTPFPVSPRPISEPAIYPGISASGPALRPSSSFPRQQTRPSTQGHWSWNYDTRHKGEFEPMGWSPKPTTPRPHSSLLEIQNSWSKADAHRRFHENLPEQAPDMRDHTRHYELADCSADLRFHHSIKHKEKRHTFYGLNSYHFYNGNPIV
ncbi:unnamed protein product [Clavelina lepadiformis]|uniref:Uncharacterized protein n=1 Tax=Clavelina lepadiformis TaxID=159417 RepID=A0ABP0FI27_CLALP